MIDNSLRIYEQIMLLALKDTEGTITPMVNYHYALAGAFVAELLLTKSIKVEKSKHGSTLIQYVSDSETDDEILKECIQKIKTTKRNCRIETWVSKFANFHHLKHRVAEKLVARGILKADEDKVLLIFKRKIYPEINSEPEQKIVENIRKVILFDTVDVDPEMVILISIAKSTNLLKTLFSKSELKTYKDRINQVINGEVTGKAAKEAIDAMQAAVMVAVIIPTVITTTS